MRDERGSPFVPQSRDYGVTREALSRSLGDRYPAYMKRTIRLRARLRRDVRG